MRSSSSSSSSSSSDDNSVNNRIKTILNKTYEISTLCGVEACVIYYGPDGSLKTWPEERHKVKATALRYMAATKRKNILNLHDFLAKDKKQLRKKSYGIKYPTWYPVFDHYSPHQLRELLLSLHRNLQSLQQRHEAHKQRNTNLALAQNIALNPTQFSLYMFNHGDATFSQIPLSHYQNHLMLQNHNITNTNFHQPNSGQESHVINNFLTDNLMQQPELYGFDHNMCMMKTDIPHSDVFSSDFQ